MQAPEDMHQWLMAVNPLYRLTWERMAERQASQGETRDQNFAEEDNETQDTNKHPSKPLPRFSYWGSGQYRAH